MKIWNYLAVLAMTAISCFVFIFTACEQPTDPPDPTSSNSDITYTAIQIGGVDGTADSIGMVFTFSASVDNLNLTITDIIVGGKATKNIATEFTGSEKGWTLSPITVNAAGTATVTIVKTGIETTTKSITVYKEGQLAPETVIVTWHLNGGAFSVGSSYPTIIDKDSVLTRPSPDPTKANNTFIGWYTNTALTQAYNFTNTVTANLDLYAKWEAGNTPAHIHDWDRWAWTDLAGTEERICKADNSHTEQRLTGTERFTFELISGTAAYSVGQGTDIAGLVRIPDYYRPSNEVAFQPVTAIGSGYYYGFSNCTSLTGIIIPEGIMSIGNQAFYGCTGLTSIIVNVNNPNYASEGAIIYNKAKTTLIQASGGISGSVTIPIGVISIGEYAFSACTGLTDIIIPASVTSIGNYAFALDRDNYYYYNQMALTTVTFAEGSQLATIGDNAFQNCTNLTNIAIPTNVTSIGDFAFSGCTGLTDIIIPASVTSIGFCAFSGENYYQFKQMALTSVTFAEGSNLVTIGSMAFSMCASLATITIPASVMEIGWDVFYGCTGLTNITVDINNPNYASQDGILYNKAKTNFIHIPQGISGSVTIPDSVTSIGNQAFQGCFGLTNITIPVNVTSIGYGAFSNCIGLASITIPANVTSIGDYAFYGCDSLTTITIPASVTSIGNGAFESCDSLTSAKFEGTIDESNFSYNSFPGDLKDKYFAGGMGTYTRDGNEYYYYWTKEL